MTKSDKVLRDFIIAIRDDDDKRTQKMYAHTPDHKWQDGAIGNLVAYCKNLLDFTTYDPFKGIQVNLVRHSLNEFTIGFGNFNIQGKFLFEENVKRDRDLCLTLELWYRDGYMSYKIESGQVNSAFGVGYLYNQKRNEWEIKNELDKDGKKIFQDRPMTEDSFYDYLGTELTFFKFENHGTYSDYLAKQVDKL